MTVFQESCAQCFSVLLMAPKPMRDALCFTCQKDHLNDIQKIYIKRCKITKNQDIN